MSDTEHKSNPVVLFLDDDENRTKAFVSLVPFAKCVATAADMIRLLIHHTTNKIKVDSLFLDHDLGGEVYVDSSREDCGMEVVRWLCNNHIDKEEVNNIYVHTMNPAASESMYHTLLEADLRVAVLPFHLVLKTLKEDVLPLDMS